MHPRQPGSLTHRITMLLRTLMWPLPLILWLLLAAPVSAQGHALVVTVRDVRGGGIAGVSIIVRTEDGQELARQTTSVEGSVNFNDLPTVVLVAVEGQPRGGPRLYQLGADLEGVRVVLDTNDAPLTLDLRAEPDGLVRPDPATMLSLEEGGPLVVDASPIPTAALATPAPLPTARRTAITPSGNGSPEGEPPPQANWVPPVTLLIVVIAAIVLRLVQKLRRMR